MWRWLDDPTNILVDTRGATIVSWLELSWNSVVAAPKTKNINKLEAFSDEKRDKIPQEHRQKLLSASESCSGQNSKLLLYK